MDMRTDKWFGQLQLSGIGAPILANGSITSILGTVITQLRTARPRSTTQGQEICLIIRDTPFSDSTVKSDSAMARAVEIQAMVTDSDSMLREPNPDEPVADYCQYLRDQELPESAITSIAAQYYKNLDTTQWDKWISDKRAIRFRLLNSNNDEFERALPAEYRELKSYVESTYPSFCIALPFRFA